MTYQDGHMRVVNILPLALASSASSTASVVVRKGMMHSCDPDHYRMIHDHTIQTALAQSVKHIYEDQASSMTVLHMAAFTVQTQLQSRPFLFFMSYRVLGQLRI